MYINGGQEIVSALRYDLINITDLIDISAINELLGIEINGDTVTIGASERHATLANSKLLKKHTPVLSLLAENIGDAQVRNRGTIGGSIASRGTSSDWKAALLALDGIVHTTQSAYPAQDYITGKGLDSGELIIKISFHIPHAATYQKQSNLASTEALVGVFVSRIKKSCRVTVICGSNKPFRITSAEAALEKNFSSKSIGSGLITPTNLPTDIHAGAEYRSSLIDVLTRRAVDSCIRSL